MFTGMLIGREIEVLASRDRSILNLKGLVIDETKNMLVVKTSIEKQVKIPKSIVTLGLLGSKNDSLVIEGSKLIGMPADRIKS
jgi:ribonuclease P protein subunit POP4